MFIWTENGLTIRGHITDTKRLHGAMNKANYDIRKDKRKVTIRNFYEEYLNTNIYLPNDPEFEGEFFVDCDDWGWDEKGFRQLFETKTTRIEL